MPPLLKKLFATLRPSEGIIAGVDDDDCAVMRSPGKLLIVTTDYLNARPIARELGIGTYETLGRLVVAANLSDLCGTGARPEALLIAVTMNRNATQRDFRRLMTGVNIEPKRWGVPVLGGDTKLGETDAILGIAIGGASSKRNLFLKNCARPGDLLWVSGSIGSCCAAVFGLSKGYGSTQWRGWAARRITIPDLPLTKSQMLSKAKLGHGGIDISDGFSADLRRMCTASGVGAIVYAKNLPLSAQTRKIARSYGLSPWAFALGIGGDFQFLVTTSARCKARVKEMGFHFVGEIIKNDRIEVHLPDGQVSLLPDHGHRDARDVSFFKEVEIFLGEKLS